ncbi:MAG: hypothetical protein H7831_06970 [Magnetococcus sp. WYHC-3]
MAHILEIIEAEDGKGYVLRYEYLEAENRYETSYVPIESTGDEQDCMKRLLEAVAEHFGYSYDKFKSDNLNISWDRKGHKVD